VSNHSTPLLNKTGIKKHPELSAKDFFSIQQIYILKYMFLETNIKGLDMLKYHFLFIQKLTNCNFSNSLILQYYSEFVRLLIEK